MFGWFRKKRQAPLSANGDELGPIHQHQVKLPLLGQDQSAELAAMPAGIRDALNEIHAAVEVLNRDQLAAITEQAYERAAEFRARAEMLKRKKANVLRDWEKEKGSGRTGGST
jgi:hypothetical protein